MVPKREVILFSAALLLLSVPGMRAGEWKEVRILGEAGFQHAGTLDDIVPLPDGKRVLTSSRDGATRLWDLETGKLLRRYERADGGDVWGLVLLPGGKEFLSAAEHGVVSRWEVATGKELMTYQHEGTAFRLALHPAGDRFVATDNKKLVIMWELKTGKELKRFVGHERSVYTAAFVAGGDLLVTGGSDGKLKVWDTATGDCERTLDHDFEDLYTIALSPDRKRFATCSEDEFIRVYEADTVKLVWETKLSSEFNVVAWSPDGKTLAGGCQDEKIYLFDAGTGEVLKKIAVPGDEHQPVAFSPDGRELLTGGDQQLFRWDWDKGERIKPELGYPQLGESADLVAVTANGALVVAGGSDKDAVVWDAETGKLVHRHTLPNRVTALAASPKGTTLAVGTSGQKVHLIEAAGGKPGKELSGRSFQGSVIALAFDGTGARLAGASNSEEAYLWDVAGGKEVAELAGHDDDINSLAVSSTGGTVVTVAEDRTVRMWDGVTGREIQNLEFGPNDPESVIFFGKGRGILASARNKDLLGWIAEERKLAPNVDADEVRALVNDLADNSFAVRRAAIEKLVAQGPEVLPLLDDKGEDDPEVVYRLREIREKIRRADVGSELETLHSFDASVQHLAGNPATGEWAAVVGYGVRARVVIGGVEEKKLVISQELRNGRAPEAVSFSADGRTLVAVNGDGTVSVLRK